MGREIKRVAADFDWPYKYVKGQSNVWKGYQMPDHLHSITCVDCDGTGLNPATKKLSDDWYDLHGFCYLGQFPPEITDDQILGLLRLEGGAYTYRYGQDPDGKPAERPPWKIIGKSVSWQHDITQDEVQALVDGHRLMDFTHVWMGGGEGQPGWVKKDPPYVPTAEEVNKWSHHGMGHDGINQYICVKARAERLGVYGKCEACKGEGHLWRSEEHRQQHEAWEKTDPPTGPAYQIWETVTEGSPVSPPFLNPEDLARWMVENDDSITNDTTYEQWMTFILGPGWAPSLVGTTFSDGTKILRCGVQAVGTQPALEGEKADWDEEWGQKPHHVDPGEVDELFKKVSESPGDE